MIDTPTSETEVETVVETEPISDEVLKRRLLNRIAGTIVIVVGLLGSLVIFETINVSRSPAPDRRAALPPAAGPPSVPGPVAEGHIGENAVKSAPLPAAKAEDMVPERSASPDVVPVQPVPGEKSLTKPAAGRLAMLHSAEPSPPAARRAAPDSHSALHPVTQAAERHFGLQLGVFSNLANAEDLRAKLEKNGVPATIEARVRAGPFATRADADAARVKLKELGIGDSLLVTMKNRTAP